MTIKDQAPSKKHQISNIEADVMLLANNKSVVRPQLTSVTNLKAGTVSSIPSTSGAHYEH